MTLPYEEKVTINNTRIFLARLLYSQLIPGIPKAVRKEAHQLLKHYPGPYKIDVIFKHYFNSGDIICPRYFLTRYMKIAPEYYTLQSEMLTVLDSKGRKKKRKKK